MGVRQVDTYASRFRDRKPPKEPMFSVLQKVGIGIIIAAILFHFIFCRWNLSTFTINLDSGVSVVFGVIIPLFMAFIGVILYRIKAKDINVK